MIRSFRFLTFAVTTALVFSTQAGGEKVNSSAPAQSPSTQASGPTPAGAPATVAAAVKPPVNSSAPFEVKPEALALVTFKLDGLEKVPTVPTESQVYGIGEEDGVNLSGMYFYRQGVRTTTLSPEVIAGFAKIKPMIKIGKLFAYPNGPSATSELFLYSTLVCEGSIAPGCQYLVEPVEIADEQGNPQPAVYRMAAKTWDNYHFVEYLSLIGGAKLSDGETVMGGEAQYALKVAYFLDFTKNTMTTAFKFLTPQELNEEVMAAQAAAIAEEQKKKSAEPNKTEPVSQKTSSSATQPASAGSSVKK